MKFGSQFIAGNIILNLLLFSCDSAITQNNQSQVEAEKFSSSNRTIQNNDPRQSGRAEFRNVSFNYNSQFFGEVNSEEVAETPLENETDKPGGEYPDHISFNIKSANRKQIGFIKTLPIEDYKRMYAVWKNYEEILGEEFADLEKVIKDTSFRRKNGVRKGEIPYVPFYDAHQTFQAKVEKFSFQSGQGVFFLTQINQESLLVNNEMLKYCFQGISDDGKTYILAEFSPKVSFLPNSSNADEFEDYKLSADTRTGAKQYDSYIAKITRRLDELPPDEFQPSLKYFEEIISSLKIKK